MGHEEFSDRFDVLFNNITSNQAPGVNEYEKSVFLTKAQNELVKDFFSAASAGNTLKQGFDDSLKRSADFSGIMKTALLGAANSGYDRISPVSEVYMMPSDLFIPVNEGIVTKKGRQLQVIPLRYDEYTRLMSKPFKRPLKYQAWRLITVGERDNARYIEVITNVGDDIGTYTMRYIRTLKPIILADLDGLTIEGVGGVTECELDPMLHEQVLQRGVELAKASWVASNGNDNINAVTQMGTRGE